MEPLIFIIKKYGYLILFPLVVLEGPIIALVAGFFVYLGYFQPFPAFGVLLLGDLIPDTIYYYIGRFGNKTKIAKKYGPRLIPMEKLLRNHGRKTMFFGKLAYGLSAPFLISAGLVKMPFKKFISYAFPITIFQYALIMAIGYYLGSSYNLATKYIESAGIIIAVILVVLTIGYVFFIKCVRLKIKKMEKNENCHLL